MRPAFIFAFMTALGISQAMALDANSGVLAWREHARGYYGQALDGVKDINVQAQDPDLKNRLYEVLKNSHIMKDGRSERLVESCQSAQVNEGETCVERKVLSYAKAREKMFGQIYLSKNSDGKHQVWDVYCQRHLTEDQAKNIGPGLIPDHTKINAEHTWPQSRFNANEHQETQKTDLHHLFPTDSEMNRIRGNFEFAEIDKTKGMKQRCEGNILGAPIVPHGYALTNNQRWYEVPDEHKGNVARALFYFAVRYRAAMSPLEEFYMRMWHERDPVDMNDLVINEEIYKIQGNRNPFIDFPELVDLIPDFGSDSYRKIKGASGESGGGRQERGRQQNSGQPNSRETKTTSPKTNPETNSVKKSGAKLEGQTLNIVDSNGQALVTLENITAACSHDSFGVRGAAFSSYDFFALDNQERLYKIRSIHKDVKSEAARAATLEAAMQIRGLSCSALQPE